MSKDSTYNTNQVVRIKKFEISNRPVYWVSDMFKIRGTVVTIADRSSKRILLKEDKGFIWHDTDFEKVNTNV